MRIDGHMRMSAPIFFRAAAVALLLALSAEGGAAQSMSPMRGTVTSYSDEFALKVYPRNVYPHRIMMEVRAYDQDFRPIQALIWPRQFWLAAENARPVTVLIPFEGAGERRVRVCAESVPVGGTQGNVRTQICGKFLARRVR